MKNKAMKKKFRQIIFSPGFYIGPIIVCIATFINFKKGIYSPFIISLSSIFITFLVACWAYKNKLYSIPFIISNVTKLLMFNVVNITINIAIPNPKFVWFYISIFLFSVELMVCYFIYAYNWEDTLEKLLKIGKVNIEKGFANVFMLSRDYSKNKFIYISAFVIPVLAGIGSRFIDNLNEDLKTLSIRVTILILALLMGPFLAGDLVVVRKLSMLERQNNIKFTTEYRKVVKQTQ